MTIRDILFGDILSNALGLLAIALIILSFAFGFIVALISTYWQGLVDIFKRKRNNDNNDKRSV